MIKEVENWMKQAKADLKSSENCLKAGDYYLSAFMSQQAVEKALKALYISRKKELVKTHSVSKLGKLTDIPEGLLKKLSLLEPAYQRTRYPDIENKIPVEEFGENEVSEYYNIAEEVIEWVEKNL